MSHLGYVGKRGARIRSRAWSRSLIPSCSPLASGLDRLAGAARRWLDEGRDQRRDRGRRGHQPDLALPAGSSGEFVHLSRGGFHYAEVMSVGELVRQLADASRSARTAVGSQLAAVRRPFS
jgi:hypothetical protein